MNIVSYCFWGGELTSEIFNVEAQGGGFRVYVLKLEVMTEGEVGPYVSGMVRMSSRTESTVLSSLHRQLKVTQVM